MTLRFTIPETIAYTDVAALAYNVTFTKSVRLEYTFYVKGNESEIVEMIEAATDILEKAHILNEITHIREIVSTVICNCRVNEAEVVIEGEL